MRGTAPLLAAMLVIGACGLAAEGTDSTLPSRVKQAVARDLGLKDEAPRAPMQLQILASGLRLSGDARLHVAAVHPAGPDSWLLRMECGSRVECLPFEVVLRGRGGEDIVASPSEHSSQSPALGDALAPPVVRAGQRVQLAEEISGMHLSAPAVCLQAGGVGQKIRVRNSSSGRVVLARVRSAGHVVVED